MARFSLSRDSFFFVDKKVRGNDFRNFVPFCAKICPKSILPSLHKSFKNKRVFSLLQGIFFDDATKKGYLDRQNSQKKFIWLPGKKVAGAVF